MQVRYDDSYAYEWPPVMTRMEEVGWPLCMQTQTQHLSHARVYIFSHSNLRYPGYDHPPLTSHMHTL